MLIELSSLCKDTVLARARPCFYLKTTVACKRHL